ncbi:hypothetical protein KOI35_33705 [Actinoplanes bogorensis]|uniref:LSDAT prokaryote domain-containing protein n=1 Tax=Paractinoplanes bogorensis TaxID=1610840 RepID=A0ABS5YZF0_9ACTN|nr:hypothetical protein [Actinoplanes bogorensis]MBU2668481.1 hypothetical protein [Actinoplanes bogorensis]
MSDVVRAVVTGLGDVPAAVASLGLAPRPVLVVVGGAAGLDDDLATLFTTLIAPAVNRHGAIAVDGGTDAGVMRLLGRARAAGPPFPLVGVAARGTVTFPGHANGNPDAAPLDRHHSHFVLTPGDTWGDEAPYLAAVATTLAGPHPSATVLVNGGDIALTDTEHSLAHHRPVLVLSGTGRYADRIAAASTHPASCRDNRLAALAASPLVRVVDAHNRTSVARQLDELLVANPA